MTDSSPVSIIIGTMATADRAASLRRAIESVTTDQEVPAIPIVIVNGGRFDPELRDSLQADTTLRCFYLEQGSLPNALNFGRRQVQTEFFGFLDDDDHYHPWAIRERLAALASNPAADVVVSWGERQTAAGDRITPTNRPIDGDDPLRSLMRDNWLASCGGMFRAATVSADYFDPTVPYLEWTYIAFRLALDRQIRFLETDRPHYFIADTPGSISKSLDYIFGVGAVLDKMSAWPVPADVRRQLAAKKTINLHRLAEQLRARGDLAAAWRYHLRSLAHPHGLRYLPSTRHHLAAAGRRMFRPIWAGADQPPSA